MNTPDTGALTKGVRRVFWRCTLKCALFVAAIIALEFIFLAVAVKSIGLPGWTLALSLICAMGTTLPSAIRLSRRRRKEARIYAICARNTEHAPGNRLLHKSLRAALQEDLVEMARRAGLRNEFKLLVARAEDIALAGVTASFGNKLPVKVCVTQSIAKMGFTRLEVKGIFAHEIGHALLGSAFWQIYIMPLLSVFSKALLLVQTFCLSFWCGVLLVQYVKHAGISLTTNLWPVALVAIAALVVSIVFGLALIAGWCLELAFAMIAARVNRLHEWACDKISALLVGPGILAQAMLKGERFEMKRGRSYSPPVESSGGLQRIRNIMVRLLAFHPSVAERVRRNVQSV